LRSKKGVLEVAAKHGKKDLGLCEIEYVPDPARREGLTHERDEEGSEEGDESEGGDGEGAKSRKTLMVLKMARMTKKKSKLMI
jgi:hypothetical protein